MLEALRIRDLGVIEDVEVELAAGLCVVTGETGAGKTMIVTGLQLLFGGRADATRVRAGADQATVEGRIRVQPGTPAAVRALDAGAEIEDGELLLRRTVTATGRSRAQIGGTSAPVAALGAVGDDLFTVHGQADQMRLAGAAAQRAALDGFAGIDLAPYQEAFTRWQGAERELDERVRDRASLMREADLLKFGLAEIDAVAPSSGEDLELQALAARLAAADELRLAARVAHDALAGDVEDPTSDVQDVRTLLAVAHRHLLAVADADAQVSELALRVGELSVLAADVAADLGAYGQGLDTDPARLAATESRRAELSRLVRKYSPEGSPAQPGDPGGPSAIDGVLRWASDSRGRLGEIDTSDEALGRLAERRAAAAEAARAQAALVTRARSAAADVLAAQVTTELHGLAMTHARLEVEVRPRPVLAGAPVLATADGTPAAAGPHGVEDVEFLLAPSADSPARPLSRGASGGELSRVMLALEVVLADADPVPVMVFDEVDAGVGGRAAVEVGRRLARLARRHQVIVVTHLAQVAAFGDVHLVVGGTSGGRPGPQRGRVSGGTAPGRPTSLVARVDGTDRLAELARMLAGRDTTAAREHAAELLADADADRAGDLARAER